MMGGGEECRSALEKKLEELGPSLMRALEERLQNWRHSSEARPRKATTAAGNATQLSSPPRGQEGGEWKVVEPRKKKKCLARPCAAKAPEISQLPPKGGSVLANRKVVLPRLARSSAVTLTLSEGTKTSCAEVLATARQKVPLAKVGIKRGDDWGHDSGSSRR